MVSYLKVNISRYLSSGCEFCFLKILKEQRTRENQHNKHIRTQRTNDRRFSNLSPEKHTSKMPTSNSFRKEHLGESLIYQGDRKKLYFPVDAGTKVLDHTLK